VSKLLVEGKLDAEVLGSILAGHPLVVPAGAKGSLAPECRRERQNRIDACYLRDRDFDYDPPEDAGQPCVDREHEGTVLGWHWCRHEIENYLLDPAVVVQATGWAQPDYEAQLVDAAKRIRPYQIARWVIGTARRSLPPNHELRTRPDEVGDKLRLPADLREEAVGSWARQQIAAFYDRVSASLNPAAIESAFAVRAGQLTDTALSAPAYVLTWCSGKDLLVALEPWLRSIGEGGAGEFCSRLRAWVREHPAAVLGLLPEWDHLVTGLRR
jgi:hypothetical protein